VQAAASIPISERASMTLPVPRSTRSLLIGVQSDHDSTSPDAASPTDELLPIGRQTLSMCSILALVGVVSVAVRSAAVVPSRSDIGGMDNDGFLSKRGHIMISLSDVGHAATASSMDCYTARQGDACYQAVFWAMQEGIYTNPEWYPGLESNSTFEDFQKSLLGRWGCRMPCTPAHGRCRTAEPGEKCHDHVKWSMAEGIYSHPSWFPGLSPESSFEEFQIFLAQEPENACGTPCVDSCYTARPGESCYDAVFWAMHEGINSYPEW
jgi:hypothetical protein